MDMRKLSLLLFIVSILSNEGAGAAADLGDDTYSASCPSAESVVRFALQELYAKDNTVAPALLRLVFHDCFVVGCDASILLDADGDVQSEKDAPPNLSVRGFEQIDIIKSKLEEECPGVVSCADIVILAARESVVLVGGDFYPVLTGRKDSKIAFLNATDDIPSPDFDLSKALESFAAKGFDARETVALLGGGHSTGTIHCEFIRRRLANFRGTGGPDPSIDPQFLEFLRSVCNRTDENPGLPMDYDGPGKGFGEVYFRSLRQGKALLFVDEQLTSGQLTNASIDAYAADIPLFQTDFGRAMIKLSNLGGADDDGEVRQNCRKRN